MDNNPFITALEQFSNDFNSVASKESTLLSNKNTLERKLEKSLLVDNKKIKQDNSLAKLTEQLKLSVKLNLKEWNEALENSLPMKALSEQFTDRIILLVFGKVNAGKSSFCNFLAEQFPVGQVKRFCFKEGKVQYFKSNERFAEGVTETTATIQGIELGNNLVLLDSPGLHSVTDENGDLTRQYTDCADAVLWLSPSTSPGQVQELQDLKEELEKNKPLQPVITRSDELIEDYCDIKDDLITLLKNKTPSNRKLQEDDVLERVKELGLNKLVKQCVSISVHAYNASDKKQDDINSAGLFKLFERLVVIIDEAKLYKVEKANQQVLNFISDKVLAPLDKNIKPKVKKLLDETKDTIHNLNKKKVQISAEITSEVAFEIPNIISKHKSSQNKQKIADDLNATIEKSIGIVIKRELEALVGNIEKVTSNLSSGALGDFEDITVDIEQKKGAIGKAATTGVAGIGGAYGGAALGSLILPGVGTVIGGLIGGFLGGAAGDGIGDSFVETEIVKEKVGISTESIVQQATKNVKKLLPELVGNVIDEVIQSITPIESFCMQLSSAINEFEQEIKVIQRTKVLEGIF